MICYLYLDKVMGLKMDMDNTMLVFLILVHWIATYAEDRAIQLLNN